MFVEESFYESSNAFTFSFYHHLLKNLWGERNLSFSVVLLARYRECVLTVCEALLLLHTQLILLSVC